MQSNTFDKLSFLLLLIVITLLPIFVLPFSSVPLEVSKGFLLVTGLAAAFVLWALGRFFEGQVLFPKSSIFFGAFAVLAIYLLSALLSNSPQVSMFGAMLDIGSFWFVFLGFMLMIMSAMIFRTGRRAKLLLFGVVVSSVILLLFQAAYLFWPQALSLGILGGKTANIFGSWNALGLFAGFAALMFLLFMEFFPISRLAKFFSQICLLLALLFAATVNFYLSWILLGISALLIFVYKASVSYREGADEAPKKHFPAMSFLVVVVSILFLLSGQFVGNFIPEKLGIANTEVNPSFSATINVGKNVIIKDPVLGLGPNRFSEAWALYKPQPINQTIFWDVPFEAGFGLIPTFLATTGVLGILAWLWFFAAFLKNGISSIFSSIKNGINWEVMAFFVLSLYLFIALFFYSGGMVLFLLGLAFTGVFVGLAAEASGREASLSFVSDHRKSFFSMLVLIVLVIAAIVLAFKYYERFASVVHIRKALAANDMAQAEAQIQKAVALNMNDIYLRTYSQIYLVKLNSLVNSNDTSEENKALVQTTLDQAVRSAELAVNYNPENYLNLRLLGSVYEAAGILKAGGAYEKALEAYGRASVLNPLNPGLKFSMARVAAGQGKLKDALKYAEEALALAPNDQGLADYVKSLRNKISIPAPAPTIENTAD